MELQVYGESEKLNNDLRKTKELLKNRQAVNTKVAYLSDWSHFESWCDERNLESMPASKETVALYAGSMAGDYKPSTISRHLVSISRAHKEQHYDSPALRSKEPLHSVWTSIVRTYGSRRDKKTPLLIEDIRLIIDGMDDDSLMDRRDKALLLMGWAGGLRRSEITGMNVSDVEFVRDGMKVLIPRAKRDQEGEGLVKGIVRGDNPSTCPVNALRFWLKMSGITAGPVFRGIDRHGNISEKPMSGKTVARIVKKLCREIGLDDDMYAGHSLRSGFATQAARSGVIERKIMRHTGHKSEASVREYIHDGDLFENNPTSKLGL